MERLGTLRLRNQLITGKIAGRSTTKLSFLLGSFVAIIFALANLQAADQTTISRKSGSDVVFALDVSKSMLAKDLSPDRLTRAKILLETVLSKMTNNRVGLVVFAGRAYLQAPLTTDYGTIKMILNTVSPETAPTQGTVLSEAIDMSKEAFNIQNKSNKTLVLISDGEDHEAEAVDKAKEAAEKGITILTIGIGSPTGAPIFDPTTGTNKRDNQGTEVISKLNESTLQEIAKAGKGYYQHLQNTNEVAANILAQVSKADQEQSSSQQFLYNKSYYSYFVYLALFFLLLHSLVPKAGKSRVSPNSSKVKSALPTLLLFVVVSTFGTRSFAQDKTMDSKTKSLLIKGNEYYTNKKYSDAEKTYNEILEKNQKNPTAYYNSGNALFQTKKYDAAVKNYEKAIALSNEANLKAKSYHNIGNALSAQKKWSEAVEAYKNALRKNPSDQETKYNLAFAQKMLKKQQEEDKKDNKDQDKNKDKEKEQQDKKDKEQQEKDKKDKEQKDKEDQQKKDEQDKKDKEKEQQNQAKPDQQKMNKQKADQLLNAIQQQEQKVQERKTGQQKPPPGKLDKDW